MSKWREVVLVGIYFISILIIAFVSVAQYPLFSLLCFILSHVTLFYLLFHNQSALLRNKICKIQHILIIAILVRMLYMWHPVSDDLARYAWEGKKITQGINPYVNAPLWFTETDILDMEAKEKNDLVVFLENIVKRKIGSVGSLDANLQVCTTLNECISQKQFPELLKKYKEGLVLPNFSGLSENEITEANRALTTQCFPSLYDEFQVNVNHKNMTAIYPPITLLIFAGLMKISYSVLAFKVLVFICDLICIFFIVKILQKHQKPLYWSLLYVLSPLVLLYGVGECHLDILQNTFLVSAVYFLLFSKLNRWLALGFILLGCAILTKYLALIALPFLIKRQNYFLSFLAILPFLTFFYFLEPGMWSSLHTFFSQMHFNDAIPRILRYCQINFSIYQLLIPCIYFSGYLFLFILYQDVPIKGILYAWVWLLFCLPVLHPWYLLVILLLHCLYPMRNIFYLSGVMGLYFFVLSHQLYSNGEWMEFWWLPLLTYVGFVLFVGYEKLFLLSIDQYPSTPIKSLDIVIPVYNEGKKIAHLMTSLQKSIHQLQNYQQDIKISVLVVDGKSTDDTLEYLKNLPVKIITSEERGRGNQISDGFQNGQGDLVLFLHADAEISEVALIKMVEAFQNHSSLAWGVLGHVYDEKKVKLKIIERLNSFRFKFLGIAFGDQGIFVRREILIKSGMPKIPLMEDVELSLRLGQYPNRINLNGLLVASSRRWVKRKFLKSVFQVVYLCLKYLTFRRMGGDIKKISKKIYAEYYA